MNRGFISLVAILSVLIAGAQHIAVLSDIHVTPGSMREDHLVQVVEELNTADYDFVIVNGDLTNEGSDVELTNVKAILDQIRHPMYLIPGNHENNWSQSATKTFTDLWGDDRFVFTCDSLLVVGINCGPYMKMGDGHIKQEDLHWLKSTLDTRLQPGMRVLSFNHYPIRKDDIDNYQEYSALLQQYPVIAHINGHYHTWDTYCVGKVPAVMVRALEMGKSGDDTGYTTLCIADDTVRVYEKKLGQHPMLRYCLGQALQCAEVTDEPSLSGLYDMPEPIWTDSASVFNRLAFDADKVYFGTSTGVAKAVDKATGQLVWEYATESRAPIFSRFMVLGEGRIAVPHAMGISILDTATGELIQEISSKAGPYVADGILAPNGRYIQGGYKRIECIDGTDCSIVWTYDSIYNYCQAAPLVDGGDLVFGAWDTYLRCLDAESGALKWRWNNGTKNNMTGPGNVVPVVTEDRVIIVAPDRYITALDRKTGQQIWRDKSYKYRESLGVSADKTKAYAKTMDGELVAVDTRDDEFRTVWVADMGIGYDHAPCVVAECDGVVYAGSRRGIVTALNAVDGTILWQRQYGSSEINGIDIDAADGAVWVSLIEGKVVKL